VEGLGRVLRTLMSDIYVSYIRLFLAALLAHTHMYVPNHKKHFSDRKCVVWQMCCVSFKCVISGLYVSYIR